jgi:hypothetical protein
MQIRKIFFICISIIPLIRATIDLPPYHQPQIIYLYAGNNNRYQSLEDTLKKFNINFEITNNFGKQDGVYLIPDVDTINQDELPNYYIAYQTLNLEENILTDT